MSSVPKRRLQSLSQQLVEGIPSRGTFESIPRIRTVAGPSAGPRASGKVIIITGANSAMGIGRATAHQFAENGALAIYICDYDDSLLETHKKEITSLYPQTKIECRKVDVGDESAVRDLIDDALRKYGRVDVMFANAGISGTPAVFSEISADDYMKTMRVNALGVFLCAKYAAKAMMVTGKDKKFPQGSIVATASVAALNSNAGGTDYSASKAAVKSMAQTMAYQLTGTGVRINAIAPGLIETGMTAPVFSAARGRGNEKKIGQINPLQRYGVADEIARVALFLGSDEASYVNGQTWAVCGGLSAGHPYVPGKVA